MSNSHEPKCKKVENIPSNMRSYYCSDCDAMHKNDVTYKRPKWFCTVCGYHVPYENKEYGTCPACDHDEHDELDWSEIRDESSRGFSDDDDDDDDDHDEKLEEIIKTQSTDMKNIQKQLDSLKEEILKLADNKTK